MASDGSEDGLGIGNRLGNVWDVGLDRVGFGIGDDEIDEVVRIGGNDEVGDGICDVGIVCGDTFQDERNGFKVIPMNLVSLSRCNVPSCSRSC
jgi:hypothetical protein